MLARFPRRRFCHLPTPLEELPALSRHLGGPTVLAKRDDCTGLALGGNKNRKLEFILAEALAAGADTLVTAGGVQSNHCRQTAAAAARHGLACELVLSRAVPSNDPAYPRSGNVLLDRLFGARLNYVGAEVDWAVELEAVAGQVRRRGGRPHIVPVGGSTPTGALGYVACGQEILQQAEAAGRPIDAVVHCSGSGGTQAGLLVGLQGSGVPVIGVSSGRARATLTGQVLELADQTLAKLGRRGRLEPDAVEVLDAYVGAGYGMPTPGMLEALELCARLEGLVLDPVYTGKAMAGLIDLIRQGRFGAGQTVVFVHTGGVPAIFAYQDAVMPD